MKLNISAALVAAILPFGQIIVEGNGKLWNASRDAFCLALKEFPKPEDAAGAVKQVITDDLKANPGSARAYLSTLVWLASAKDSKGNKAGNLKAAAISELSMQAATDLRYPKEPKLAADDFEGKIKRLTEKKKAADKAKAEKDKAEAEADAKDPRRTILRTISQMLAQRDATTLELIAASISETLKAIDESDAAAAAANGSEGESAIAA